MFEVEVDISETSSTSDHLDWHTANPSLSVQQVSPASSQPCPAPTNAALLQPSTALSQPETESSCMEIEAAQRKLQEIEDRYETCMVCKNCHLTTL